jgi:hypothetical protein
MYACSLKTLTNSGDCHESRISFFIFSLIGGNSPNNIHGCLSEQFQGVTRLLEQLLLSQAAIRKL